MTTTNPTKLPLAALRAEAVSKVEVEYEGDGGEVKAGVVAWGTAGLRLTVEAAAVADVVEWAKWEIAARHPDWPEGPGGYGLVVVDVESTLVTLNHTARVVTEVHYDNVRVLESGDVDAGDEAEYVTVLRDGRDAALEALRTIAHETTDPLEAAELREIADRLGEPKPEPVAVCSLHGEYRGPVCLTCEEADDHEPTPDEWYVEDEGERWAAEDLPF